MSNAKKEEMQQLACEMDVGAVQEAAREVEEELAKRGGGMKLVVHIDWGLLEGSWRLPSWRWPQAPSMPTAGGRGMGMGGMGMAGVGGMSMGSMGGLGGGGSWGWGGGKGKVEEEGGGGGGVDTGAAYELMVLELSNSKREGREVDVGEVRRQAMKASMMRSAEAGEALSVEQMSRLRVELEQGIGQVSMLCHLSPPPHTSLSLSFTLSLSLLAWVCVCMCVMG